MLILVTSFLFKMNVVFRSYGRGLKKISALHSSFSEIGSYKKLKIVFHLKTSENTVCRKLRELSPHTAAQELYTLYAVGYFDT